MNVTDSSDKVLKLAEMPGPRSGVPITVVVRTLNEEKRIERCLRSTSWAHEWVIVDSGSTDRTIDIATRLGARVFRQSYLGDGAQREFGARQAKNDWIFSIDADEWVSDELRKALLTRLDRPMDNVNALEVNRLSWYLGRWNRHGTWYPDYLMRLYHRGKTNWTPDDFHAELKPNGPVERVSGHLLHEPYNNLSHWWRKVDRFSSGMARVMEIRGKRVSVMGALFHGLAMFFRYYIARRGFLDGSAGLMLATLSAFYTFFKYAKLWESQLPLAGRLPDAPN